MWVTTKFIVKETKKNQKDLAEKIEKIFVEQRDTLEALKQQNSEIIKLMEGITGKLEQIEKKIHDTSMSENIKTMNTAMQEIMGSLLSLDEGNRLIIAKLLLRDMEI